MQENWNRQNSMFFATFYKEWSQFMFFLSFCTKKTNQHTKYHISLQVIWTESKKVALFSGLLQYFADNYIPLVSKMLYLSK